MNNNIGLIYKVKQKRYLYEDPDKVIIEFKDDATAFNAQKEEIESKGIELSYKFKNFHIFKSKIFQLITLKQ